MQFLQYKALPRSLSLSVSHVARKSEDQKCSRLNLFLTKQIVTQEKILCNLHVDFIGHFCILCRYIDRKCLVKLVYSFCEGQFSQNSSKLQWTLSLLWIVFWYSHINWTVSLIWVIHLRRLWKKYCAWSNACDNHYLTLSALKYLQTSAFMIL